MAKENVGVLQFLAQNSQLVGIFFINFISCSFLVNSSTYSRSQYSNILVCYVSTALVPFLQLLITTRLVQLMDTRL